MADVAFAFSGIYTFSSGIVEPPTSNQLRLNAAAPYDTVSKIWVRYLTADGVDGFYAATDIAVETEFFLQDKNDHLRYARFRVTAAPVDKTDYVEYTVAWVASSGTTFANNQDVLFAVFAPTVPVPPPLALDTAKQHLKIPIVASDPGDPDLTAKLAAAEATIYNYVSRTEAGRTHLSDWVTAGAPPAFVTAAILLQLGELWRFRGDDLETPPRDEFQDLSPTIVALLRRVCDPVLA
jgi:hypothetical protein